MRDTSPEMLENLMALQAAEPLITCFEMTHPELDEPIFVCNDAVDLVAFGHTYIACPVKYKAPDDSEDKSPLGSISIDNIGGYTVGDEGNRKSISQWVDQVDGGNGVQLTIFETIRSAPLKEHIITVDIGSLTSTKSEVSAQIGYMDASKRPAVRWKFDRERAPGCF